MKNRLSKTLLISLLLLLFLMPQLAFAGTQVQENSNDEYLQSLMQFIQENYNFDVSNDELLKGSVEGMFNSLDQYSAFYSSEDAEKFSQSISGTYEGIGVVISEMEGYVVITRVFPYSPAEEASLFAGDKIVLIEGDNVIGATSSEVSVKLRGEAGTKVNIGIVRNGEDEVIPLTVERRQIKLNPVRYEIKGDIAYLSIDSFNSNTYNYFAAALADVDQNNVKKIILDLRYNTGGEVKQAIAIARHFVPEGIIAKLDFKSEKEKDQVYRSELKESNYELVVLINEMTASASEILAGAIQDSKAGVLLGEKSYGKGRVGTVVPLLSPEASQKYKEITGESMVSAYDLIVHHGIRPAKNEILGLAQITTGIYTTRDGHFIDGKGLSPDVQVEDHGLVNGIYVNNIRKLTKEDKPSSGDESIDVYNAEKVLLLSGYDVEKPDITLDTKTFEAIKKFQRDKGLYPYGVLDFTTQQAFNDEIDKLLMEIDKQYAQGVHMLEQQ